MSMLLSKIYVIKQKMQSEQIFDVALSTFITLWMSGLF